MEFSSPLTSYLSTEDEFLPPSSPLVDRQARIQNSQRESEFPATPRSVLGDFDDLSSSGPLRSSPIIGTRAERTAKRRIKAGRRKSALFAATRQAKATEKRPQRICDLDEVLNLLKSKSLRFADLMEYVFDPNQGKGTVRYHEFFVYQGLPTKILDWWISHQNGAKVARDEVKAWAINLVAKTVAREAGRVTRSRKLQTKDKPINGEFVSSFSFSEIHNLLQEEDMAPVAMQY